MQTVELEALIDEEGRVQIPIQYRHFYGQQVRLVVSAPEGFTVLFASLEHFPDNFMPQGREQPAMQEREPIS